MKKKFKITKFIALALFVALTFNGCSKRVENVELTVESDVTSSVDTLSSESSSSISSSDTMSSTTSSNDSSSSTSSNNSSSVAQQKPITSSKPTNSTAQNKPTTSSNSVSSTPVLPEITTPIVVPTPSKEPVSSTQLTPENPIVKPTVEGSKTYTNYSQSDKTCIEEDSPFAVEKAREGVSKDETGSYKMFYVWTPISTNGYKNSYTIIDYKAEKSDTTYKIKQNGVEVTYTNQDGEKVPYFMQLMGKEIGLTLEIYQDGNIGVYGNCYG